MNVLILTDEPPVPGGTGVSLRYFQLVRALSMKHHVTIFCLSRVSPDNVVLAEVENCGCRVEVIHIGTNKLMHLFHCLGALLRGEPFPNGYFWSWSARRSIRRLCREQRFDIVHVEHAHMAQYLSAIKKPHGFKSVLFLHNIGPVMFRRIYEVEDRFLRKLEFWLAARFSETWEPRICVRFNRCVVFSENDRRNYMSYVRGRSPSIIPFGLDAEGATCLPPPDEGGDLLFIGKMSYPPNRDAVHYFCRNILPLIHRKRGDVRLHVVGRPVLSEFEEYARNGAVDIVGWVDDPVVLYRRCALSIVPIRAGSGIRMKILESLALGRPVVSTSLGCEGLGLTHGENIWIADTPEAFAEGVLHLLSDGALWRHLTGNGRRFIEENHECGAIARDVLRLYDELVPVETP
jgi:polysaccharide biosynthesis protein PslH